MNRSPSRRRALRGVLACAAALALPSLSVHASDAVLRVSAIPDEAPTELQRKFAPWASTWRPRPA